MEKVKTLYGGSIKRCTGADTVHHNAGWLPAYAGICQGRIRTGLLHA